jgi:hypothetical protein
MPDEKPFDDSVLKNLVNTQQSDQYAEAAGTVTQVMDGYRKALAKTDIPPHLLDEMLLDYHWLFLGSMLLKTGGLPPRGHGITQGHS